MLRPERILARSIDAGKGGGMFERNKPGARPAFLPGIALYEKQDPLRHGRPGPALEPDQQPSRQLFETPEEPEER